MILKHREPSDNILKLFTRPYIKTGMHSKGNGSFYNDVFKIILDSNNDKYQRIRSLVFPDWEGVFSTERKLILLHEEFKKPTDKIKSHRMSRHLYDIVQIMGTDYYEVAINDKTLLRDICMHREKFTPLKPIGTINYSKLTFENMEIIPPKEIIDDYRNDYKEMQSTMFYGESENFDKVIARMKSISKK